jgi:hypothetical protein
MMKAYVHVLKAAVGAGSMALGCATHSKEWCISRRRTSVGVPSAVGVQQQTRGQHGPCLVMTSHIRGYRVHVRTAEETSVVEGYPVCVECEGYQGTDLPAPMFWMAPGACLLRSVRASPCAPPAAQHNNHVGQSGPMEMRRRMGWHQAGLSGCLGG